MHAWMYVLVCFSMLGFGVPYFDTFFLKGNHYEIKVYTFFSLVT